MKKTADKTKPTTRRDTINAAADRYAPVSAASVFAKWDKEPEFKKEYEALADEFALYAACLHARRRAHLSQAEVAKRMGTSQPAVARIESGTAKTLPGWNTIRRYAQAIGCRVKIEFEPVATPARRQRVLAKRVKAVADGTAITIPAVEAMRDIRARLLRA